MNARLREVGTVSAEPLLMRLDRVQRQGNGWRARCSSCEGTSRKLTVAESDGRVLVHCFGGCKVVDVLTAVGMTFADLMPPRHWPETREERRKAQRAIREAGLMAAFDVIYSEGQVIEIAANAVSLGIVLNEADQARLKAATRKVSDAYIALRDFDWWSRRNPA